MELRLLPSVEAPREARQSLAPLAERLDEDTHAAVTWVVSELVAVSVAHGASNAIEIRLSLDAHIDGIVEDQGPGTRAMVRARDERDPPLVLVVVDALTDEWSSNVEQTCICFRITPRRRSSGSFASGRRRSRSHPREQRRSVPVAQTASKTRLD